jgi:hypothetical protein
VKKSIGYRLFRIGKMPVALKELAASGTALVSDEGVSIKFSARGLRAPGRYISRGVKLHAGAVVVTADRVALSIGKRVALDLAYGDAKHGQMTLTVDGEGVHLHLDVEAALPGGSGTLDITARAAIEGTPLVGTRHMAVDPAVATAITRWA